MKIEQSQVQLAASHHEMERHERSESLRMWRDGGPSLEYHGEEASLRLRADDQRLLDGPPPGPPPFGGPPEQARPNGLPFNDDELDLSPAALAVQAEEAAELKELDDESLIENLDDLKLNITKLMIEAFTGREIEIYQPKPKDEEPPEGEGERVGWGMSYDYQEVHIEAEQTSFQAHGVVHTADGRQIDFTAELEMSRYYESRESLSLRAGDALKDPLVLNFNGSAAQLTEERMAFDIDGDGNKDQIALLAPNSAYLALDRNGDGRINDGTELFGPRTGNGFNELEKLDDDGNRWIDENDAAWEKLQLWQPSAGEGLGSLRSLADQNVGAIYLGRVSTSFDMKDNNNELQGKVRSSGVYLNEDGTPGTIQQIDLVA